VFELNTKLIIRWLANITLVTDTNMPMHAGEKTKLSH